MSVFQDISHKTIKILPEKCKIWYNPIIRRYSDAKQVSLAGNKTAWAVRFPFNIYPCTIPGDFPQVALHWQESMELIFVKRGAGLVQAGAVTHLAYMGDIFILHRVRSMHSGRQRVSIWV